MARDRVLVTGASGFIAKHIVVELLRHGFDVRGSVRNDQRAEEVRRAVRASGEDADRCEFAGADLGSGEGWLAAATGCRYVLHTASPFPLVTSRQGRSLVATARKGTDFVLRAGARAGVERAIVTSSIAAILYGHEAMRMHPFGEGDFTNLKSRAVSSYARSKTEAELLAWDLSRETGLPVSTINPGLVLGPLLDARQGSSSKIVGLVLSGRVPLLPNIAIPTVDVRDVATAHVRAMVAPEAGRRFIVAAPDVYSVPELADILAEAFPDRARKIPRRKLPDAVLRAAGIVSPSVAMLIARTGRATSLDTAPARDILGLDFIPAKDAVVAMADSLVRNGCV